MDIDTQARLTRLEGDVAQLKKLAVINQKLDAAKASQSTPKPKGLNFTVKLLIFFIALAAVLMIALPFIASIFSAKFDAIESQLTTEP